MNTLNSGMDLVQFIGKLGDLKEDHWHITLELCAVVELLIEKGIISREELERKTAELDRLTDRSPYPMA